MFWGNVFGNIYEHIKKLPFFIFVGGYTAVSSDNMTDLHSYKKTETYLVFWD